MGLKESSPFDAIEHYVNELLIGGATEIRFAEADTHTNDWGLVISDRKLTETQVADAREQYGDSFEPN